MARYKIYYEDGFSSHWMNELSLNKWFKMNDENNKSILAIQIQERITRDQAKEFLKKFSVDS